MPKSVIQYDLLISCPGDIKDEVNCIKEVVDQFNATFADSLGISIRTKHWSKNSILNLVVNHKHFLMNNL